MSDLTISQSSDYKNQLISTNSAVSLNFGAFAKGYGIALEIKKLQALGIKNAVINAGGDLSVIGQHGDRAWNIGIRHPRNDTLLASVKVADNESVFTSGDYERVYYHDNKRFHHILDPRTGYPTQDAQSVTVIHSDAGRADAAATALFVAGMQLPHRERDVAAHGEADHIGALDLGLVENARQIVGVPLHRELEAAVVGGRPEAAQVGREARRDVRQVRDLRRPHRVVQREAVDEQRGGALPELQPRALDVERAHGLTLTSFADSGAGFPSETARGL